MKASSYTDIARSLYQKLSDIKLNKLHSSVAHDVFLNHSVHVFNWYSCCGGLTTQSPWHRRAIMYDLRQQLFRWRHRRSQHVSASASATSDAIFPDAAGGSVADERPSRWAYGRGRAAASKCETTSEDDGCDAEERWVCLIGHICCHVLTIRAGQSKTRPAITGRAFWTLTLCSCSLYIVTLISTLSPRWLFHADNNVARIAT